MRHYWQLLKFLGGDTPTNLSDRAILLTEVNTAFGVKGFGHLAATSRISSEFLTRVNSISPRLAVELWDTFGNQSGRTAKQTAVRLGIVPSPVAPTRLTMAQVAGVLPLQVQHPSLISSAIASAGVLQFRHLRGRLFSKPTMRLISRRLT